MISEVVHASRAAEAVGEAIATIRQDNAMVPIVVWCESGEAARSMSRLIAQRQATFDVTFLHTRRLAERILHDAGVTVDKPSLDSALASEIVRKVSLGAQGPLKGSISPPLVAELGRAFRELRSLPEDNLSSLETESSILGREVLRLYRQYEMHAAGMVDRADLLRDAMDAINSGSPRVVRVVSSDDVMAGDALEEALETRLSQFGLLSRVQLTNEMILENHECAAAKVFIDPASEANGVVAQILEWADAGANFGSMTIVHGQHHEYGSELEIALDEAGIAWRSAKSLTVANSALLGFVTGVVRYVSGAHTVPQMLQLLATGPFLRDSEQRFLVPLHRWTNEIRRIRASLDPLELIERLSATKRPEMAEFFGELHQLTSVEFTSWAQWCSWLDQIVNRYFDFESLDDEQADAQRTRLSQVLSRLEPLDKLGVATSAEWFAAAVIETLDSATTRRTSGSAVLLTPLNEAAGIVSDNVVVCGLAGDAIHSTSPVTASIRLPDSQTDRDKTADIVRGVVAGAKRVQLSYARTDTSLGREVAPAPVLIDVASSWAGRPVSAAMLIDDKSFAWLEVVPSFVASIQQGNISISRQFDRLRALGLSPSPVDLVAVSNVSESAVECVTERSSDHLSRFDGLVGPLALPSELSATTLEKFAECPRRYFFASVLKIDRHEQDPDLWQMAPTDKGNLVHHVLERFVRENASLVADGSAWPQEARDRMRSLLLDEMELARQDGRLPGGALGRWYVDALLNQLQESLNLDDRKRTETGLVPLPDEVETRFGSETDVGPVRISLDNGKSIAFRGRVDRVDANSDHTRVRATDYKTGTVKAKGNDIASDGMSLQPGLYAAHLAQKYPDARVSSVLWSLSEAREKSAWTEYEWNEHNRQRFEQVIASIVSNLENGVFPAVPGDDSYLDPTSHEHCRNCPYDVVCPVNRGDAWVRKSSDPVLVDFHGLKEGGVEHV